MSGERYVALLPWRIRSARRRGTDRSGRPAERERTNRSWPRVRRWNARATSAGTAPSPGPAGPGTARRAVGATASRSSRPAAAPRPGEAEGREPGRRGSAGRRLDLGGGQQVGERIQVVADADPALGAGLERRRPAAAERVEHDVAGPAVAGDEGVGQRRREAREVRAHRVEGVAPEALLLLPLRRDVEARQRRAELPRSSCSARAGPGAPAPGMSGTATFRAGHGGGGYATIRTAGQCRRATVA